MWLVYNIWITFGQHLFLNMAVNKSSTLYCGNCGKEGHLYKDCHKPITSFGIICFRRVNYPSSYENTSTIEIILIRRKFTIGYMELIRGKYQIENEAYISQILDMMTVKEKHDIKTIRNYDILRANLGTDRDTPSYKREQADGKAKFDALLVSGKLDELIDKSLAGKINWTEAEWGIPKGRRSHGEADIDCAVREFTEETGVANINVYPNIIPLEEVYTASSGVKYRHIYYLAEHASAGSTPKKLTIDNDNPEQFHEISNLRWTSEKKCSYLIRPYYTNKLAVINKAFQMIKCLDTYFE